MRVIQLLELPMTRLVLDDYWHVTQRNNLLYSPHAKISYTYNFSCAYISYGMHDSGSAG